MYTGQMKVTAKKEMILKEGGKAEYVDIAMTMPPKFICGQPNCQIKVTATVSTSEPLSCFNSQQRRSQAVIGYHPSDLSNNTMSV